MLRTAFALLFTAFVALPAQYAVAANAYPNKPIRVLIPFPPGGGTDILARALQDKLEASLGAPIIIDNRGGAGGTLGCTIAARATPDGYTFLLTSASFTFAPGLYKDLAYDAVNDFKPITNFAQAPLVLAVHPSVPVLRVRELLDLARKRPGELRYASAGVGSNIFMTTELFLYMAKIKMTQVPYRGGGPATIGLISGEAQVIMSGVLGAIPHMKAGRMRGLAVTTKERSPALPDMPTIDEAGVPGYDKGGWTGFFAPAGVPAPIIRQVYDRVAKVLKDPQTAKTLADQGSVTVGNTPEEFTAFVRAEIVEWTKLIRQMNIKL
jgi:tripartite-type tricarboxylate transporter receptor subunit TctC